MDDPILIHKAHLDSDVRIFLIVEPVKATLSKNGSPVTANAMASAMLVFPRPFPPVMTVGLPKVSSVGFHRT